MTIRPFFKKLKGTVIADFKLKNPSFADLAKDWTSNRLGIQVDIVGIVCLVDYAVRQEEALANEFTKTRRAMATRPKFGTKYKSDQAYVQFLTPLRSYVNAGGNASILEIVDTASKSFTESLCLKELDLGFISMKEIIVLILFVKYRPLKYNE